MHAEWHTFVEWVHTNPETAAFIIAVLIIMWIVK